MMQRGSNPVENSVRVAYRMIDVAAVVLILTGQINVSGVFLFTDSGFSLSLAGPITGGQRVVGVPGTSPRTEAVVDLVDLIAAFLVMLDQINVIGTFISAHRFSIVLSGPFFGEPKRVANVPEALAFSSVYQDYVTQKCVAQKQARK